VKHLLAVRGRAGCCLVAVGHPVSRIVWPELLTHCLGGLRSLQTKSRRLFANNRATMTGEWDSCMEAFTCYIKEIWKAKRFSRRSYVRGLKMYEAMPES
jgi:hypothetical protein